MIKERIGNLIAKMSEGIYERDDEIRLALLSSIAGESIFLLGPPGVAKSLIARKLKHAYKDAKSFEYLMGRFSTPDEVFGPVSIQKLKNEDKYERIMENYLPDADIVFLDEIWKASPAIQNSLLTAINEKLYRNGNQEIKLKMKGLISASNELPKEDEGLEALWDRFIVRMYVDGINNEDYFNNMITASTDLYKDNIPKEIKLTEKEYKQWNNEIDKIDVPKEVLDIISRIRKEITMRNEKKKEQEKIYISDRKWKKVIRLMRASAFLNERKYVDLMDSFIIPHCIWDNETQIEEVTNIINKIIRLNGYKIGLDLKTPNKELNMLQSEIEKEITDTIEEEKVVPVFYDNNYIKIENFEVNEEYNRNRSEAFIDKQLYYSLNNNVKDRKLSCFSNKKWKNSNHSYNLKKVSEHKIQIDEDIYSVETKKVIEKKVIEKKPSQSLQHQWNTRIGTLHEFCDKQLLKIEEYKRKDLEHAKTNLFVKSELSKIAFANLDKTSHEIAKLKVELEKTRDSYESIK